MAQQAKCKKCESDFLIIDQEIDFYKEKDLPLPENCPTCRLERRMNLRDKKEFFGHNCDSCKKDIIVAFEPKENQKVYCKACYQKYMQEHDCVLGYSDGAKKEGMGPSEGSQSTPPPQTPDSAQSSGQSVSNPVSW